jgi:hypothetical protein
VVIADEDLSRVVEKVKIVNSLLGLVTIGSGCAISWKVGIDIFVGWFLMALNLELLEWQLKRMFLKSDTPTLSPVVVFVKCYLRFLAFVVVVWAIVKFGLVHPLHLAVGFFVLGISFIGVIGEMFIKMVLKREG